MIILYYIASVLWHKITSNLFLIDFFMNMIL